jgi:hypothetical protein
LKNDWVFPGTFDDLPNVSVGIRDPETANAGAFNPCFNVSSYSPTSRDNYNPMNDVSTQRLIVNQGH